MLNKATLMWFCNVATRIEIQCENSQMQQIYSQQHSVQFYSIFMFIFTYNIGKTIVFTNMYLYIQFISRRLAEVKLFPLGRY